MPLTPGTKLGQYEILSPLGAGSMGEVYRARDTQLNRLVAIKVLPDLTTDRDRMRRFEIEAQAAASINHPNILAVYVMGMHEGVPYIVSELLEGKTLTEDLRRGPLPLRKAVDYAIQIARGLAAAHDRGIVHRDLKPDNLFITKDARVKILDFGLAKVIPPNQPTAVATPTATLPGVALGTVGYMSPEQVRGMTTDHRTDIFAFGAILYEMLMGQRSFQRQTEADTISAILNEEPPAISQLAPDTPAALQRVVRRCLEKNADLRFQSASDLAFALEAFSDSALSTPSGTHPIPQTASRRRFRSAAAILIVVAIVTLAYFLLRPAPVPKVANYTQLTHDGLAKSLIGTDGARLYLGLGVGSSGSFSSHGIAEMSAGGGEPKKIAAMTTADAIPLDLSSDGSEILFVDGTGSPPRGPFRSFPILGGAPRRIGSIVGETAAWSPDGKRLAYSNLGELFIANSDGTNSRKLASVNGDIRNISWSPDDRLVRFDTSETAGTLGRQVIWEITGDGSNLHQLFSGWHDPPDECCGKWTADGKYFVFQSNGQIWALPNRGELFRSDAKPIALTSGPMALSSPLPARNGKKLYIIGQTYRGELERYDAKSAQFTPFLNGISAEYISFSKDGQWVAYVSFRQGTLWRSRIDGSERLQLTWPPMYPVLPRWSPDGKNIIFFEFALSADKPARIYEISADGGSPQALLPEDHSQQLDPGWSPDGSKIVFAGASNDPASSVRILDLAAHQVSTIPGSQGFYSPRWSPDGRYISAFTADSKKLLLFDAQTQKWEDLASDSLGWPNWSHDSQHIFVLDFGGKNAEVRIRIRDHKIEPVVDLSNLATTGRYGGALALTPDDSPLLLHDTGSQDVYSVDWIAP